MTGIRGTLNQQIEVHASAMLPFRAIRIRQQINASILQCCTQSDLAYKQA